MTSHRTPLEPVRPDPSPLRRVAAGVVGLLALQALVALFVLWSAASTPPHGIRIAVAATTPQAGQAAAARLQTSAAGMLSAFTVADVAHARLALKDRSADAAFLAGPKTTDELILASAAGPSQSTLLTNRFQAYEKSQKRTLKLAEAVPLPRADRRGTAVLHVTLVMLLGGAVGAAALAPFLARTRGRAQVTSRALAANTAFAVASALVVVLTSRFAFGLFRGHEVQAVAAGALVCAATASTIAAIHALAGRLVAGVLTLGLVVAGGLASGVAQPYAFQPGPLRTTGPYLLGGGGVDLLRNLTYFHGHAVGRPLVVLTTWLVLGFLATIALSTRPYPASLVTATPGRPYAPKVPARVG